MAFENKEAPAQVTCSMNRRLLSKPLEAHGSNELPQWKARVFLHPHERQQLRGCCPVWASCHGKKPMGPGPGGWSCSVRYVLKGFPRARSSHDLSGPEAP
eukprot:9061082-Pyramimonas_sp.AAC.1